MRNFQDTFKRRKQSFTISSEASMKTETQL